MSCEFFTTVKFQRKTLNMIEQGNAILEEYAEQRFTLTLRQLFYQFVARGLVANTVEEYKRLGRTMADARRAGLVDWDRLEDRTRNLETLPSWNSPASLLHDAARQYRARVWGRQTSRPEVWIEKAALSGVIQPACDRWRVPFMAARGYPSHSELYAAGKRLGVLAEAGHKPVVLYLGDHDPSGLNMTRSLRGEMSLYARHSIEIVRLGLNHGQIRELSLPPNPAKETDKRYAQYKAETGCTDSWELDALSPTYIDGLLEHAIADLVDQDAWDESVEQEEHDRHRLTRLALHFDLEGSQ